MRNFRLSIAGLMSIVLCIGVGVAALRSPTDLWASTIYTITLAAIGLAVPGIIYRRRAKRAFWIGFATFACVYWIASSTNNWLGDQTSKKLVTRHLIEQYHEYLTWRDMKPAEIDSVAKSLFIQSSGRAQNQKLMLALQKHRTLLSTGPIDSPDLHKANDEVLDARAELEAALEVNLPMLRSQAITARASRRNHPELTQIGHSLFTLIAGYLGGIIGLFFYRTRDEQPWRNEDPSTTILSTT